MGLFGNKEERLKLQEEKERKEKELKERLAEIKVTTGDIKRDYEIERVIFNIGASVESWFNSASPDRAFREAEAQLKVQANDLGCDAVIYTQFEHRVTVSQGVISSNQGIEVFAYGTAIKFIG